LKVEQEVESAAGNVILRIKQEIEEFVEDCISRYLSKLISNFSGYENRIKVCYLLKLANRTTM